MNEKEEAQKEYEKLKQWVLDEEEKVERRLEKEGKYIGCLDTSHEEYAYIRAERNKRIAEIKNKYKINN